MYSKLTYFFITILFSEKKVIKSKHKCFIKIIHERFTTEIFCNYQIKTPNEKSLDLELKNLKLPD